MSITKVLLPILLAVHIMTALPLQVNGQNFNSITCMKELFEGLMAADAILVSTYL